MTSNCAFDRADILVLARPLGAYFAPVGAGRRPSAAPQRGR